MIVDVLPPNSLQDYWVEKGNLSLHFIEDDGSDRPFPMFSEYVDYMVKLIQWYTVDLIKVIDKSKKEKPDEDYSRYDKYYELEKKDLIGKIKNIRSKYSCKASDKVTMKCVDVKSV